MTEEPGRFALQADLEGSPLIADVHPRTGLLLEFLWFLGALAVGLVGALLITVVIMIIVMISLMIAGGGGTDAIAQFMTMLQSEEPPTDVAGAATIMVAVATLNTLAFVAFVVLATLIRRRPLRANITAAPRFRWGQLGVGMALYAIVFSGLLAVESAIGGAELEWPILTLAEDLGGVMILVSVVVIGFLFAAFAEEILFRGWLLRESAVFSNNLFFLLILNGVLFSAFHFNPTTLQLDPNAFVARTMMGIVFCYMALRFGGIEFATGAHAANNIMLTLVVQPLTLTEPPPEPIQIGLMVESFVLLAMGVAITEFAARVPILRGLMGPPIVRPEEQF